MSVYSITLSGFSAIDVSISHGERENGNGKVERRLLAGTQNSFPRFRLRRQEVWIRDYDLFEVARENGSMLVRNDSWDSLETQSVFSFYFASC